LGAGIIEDVRVQRDKGFGFVRYRSHKEAAFAIQAANGRVICGKSVKVSNWIGKSVTLANWFNGAIWSAHAMLWEVEALRVAHSNDDDTAKHLFNKTNVWHRISKMYN
jgi:RNA recognition motif-containing protein